MKEKNNFFMNKFLPILSLFLLVLFTFSVNCYASSSQVIKTCFDERTINLDDGFDDYKYHGILLFSYPYSGNKDFGGSYFVFASNSLPYITESKVSSSGNIYRYIFTCDSDFYYLSEYGGISGKFGDGSTFKFSSLNHCTAGSSGVILTLYSNNTTEEQANASVTSYNFNFDLKDSEGNVVFQKPPQEETKVEGITIPAIQSSEEIPQAMVKTLKVLIPVGLTIFGIGLVIYLIKSVISRMQ